MKKSSSNTLALVLLLGSGATASAAPSLVSVGGPQACPDVDSENTYELFVYQNEVDKDWLSADSFAEDQFDGAVQGHLATITSAAENACIVQLFDDVTPGEAWLGGFQMQCDPVAADCGWEWVNDEGTFGPQQGGALPDNAYLNWSPNEPNDSHGGEMFAAIFLNGDDTWNDEAALTNIQAILVEYSRTAAALSCIGQPDPQDPDELEGCNPTGVQNIQIPANNLLQPEDTITEVLLESSSVPSGACTDPSAFRDPRVDDNGFPFDIRRLDVFGELGGRPEGFPVGMDLILDEHTYGRPCFAVVFGNTNFALEERFPDGVVITRLQQPELLDIGPVGQCYDPVTYPDLQKISQVTYQTDDRFDMIKETAEVVTNFCFNPSRASTFKFSFSVLNTAEHCGIDYDSRLGPVKIQLCFKLLALDKHQALVQSLKNARPGLPNAVYAKMTKKLNQAQLMLVLAQYRKAEALYEDFLEMVEDASWTIDADNHPGNLVMRAENLVFRADLLQQSLDNLFN